MLISKEDILHQQCYKHVNNMGKYLQANISPSRATRGNFTNIDDKIQSS